MPRWAQTLSLLGVVTLVFWVGFVTDVVDHTMASDLREHGRAVTVADVQLFTGCSARGCQAPEIAVRIDGQMVNLRSEGAPTDVTPAETWVDVPAGDRYAPPLQVLVDPDDINRVMAVSDVDSYTDPTLLPNDLLLAAGSTAIAAAAAAGVWAYDRRKAARTDQLARLL